MRYRLIRLKWLWRSFDNWRRGFKFGPVRRCRVCDHTAYLPDHCAGGAEGDTP